MAENKMSLDTKWEVRRHATLMRGLMMIITGLFAILISILAYFLQNEYVIMFGVPIGVLLREYLLSPSLRRRYYAQRAGYIKLPGETFKGTFRAKSGLHLLLLLIASALCVLALFILLGLLISMLEGIIAPQFIGVFIGIMVITTPASILVMYWGYRTKLREMFYMGCCLLIGLPLFFGYVLVHAVTRVDFACSLFLVIGILVTIQGLFLHRRYLKWWQEVERLRGGKEDIIGIETTKPEIVPRREVEMRRILIVVIGGLTVIWGSTMFVGMCIRENEKRHWSTEGKTIPEQVKLLIKQIKSTNLINRFKKEFALARISDKSAVKPLIEALKDKNERIRSAAAEALGNIGDKSAVKPLIETLRDESSSVRFKAVWALGRIGDKSAVQPLIEALKDEHEQVSSSAAYALGRIGDKSAVKPLIEALKDENDEVRSSATTPLGKIGDKSAVKPLIEALKDEYKSVRRGAAGALGNIGDQSAVKPLIETLRDEDEWVRHDATTALGKIGDKSAVKPLIKALKDGSWVARREAVRALGNIGDRSAAKSLIEALKHKDERVRRNAAEALGKIGDKSAVKPLIETLRDEDIWVRRDAATALGKIGDKSAVKPLIETLKDEHKSVREWTSWALKRITGKNFGEDYDKWQEWWEANKEK